MTRINMIVLRIGQLIPARMMNWKNENFDFKNYD